MSSAKQGAFVKPSSETSKQESQITSHMNTWLNSLFDYYAQDNAAGAIPTVSQTMQKVIAHLDAISENLRATYPPGPPTSTPLNEGSQPSDTTQVVKMEADSKKPKEGVQMSHEPEKDLPGLVEYSLSSESLPETIPAAPALIVTGSSTSSITKAATENKNTNSSVNSAQSSLQIAANDESSVTSNTDPTCCICLEVVSEVSGRKYALLEQCSHPYCEPCVRSLLEHNGLGAEPIRCPTCRTATARIIVRESFLASGPQKTALFESLICCPPHHIHSDHSEEDVQAVEEEDEAFELMPTMDDVLVDNLDLITSLTDAESEDNDDHGVELIGFEEQNQDSEENEEVIVLDSSVSLGSGQSIDFSIEITGRSPADAIYEEDSAGELHLLWSSDEEEGQVEDEVETASDEDVFTSYSSSDEETDSSFDF